MAREHAASAGPFPSHSRMPAVVVVANYASDVAKADAFTHETGIAARKWDVSDFDACVAAGRIVNIGSISGSAAPFGRNA